MVHSIELLLDSQAEAAVREQWRLLDDAGLPTEHRRDGDVARRPHITLIACEQIAADTAAALSPLLAAAVPMPATIGAPSIFGTAKARRPSLLLVRQVLPTVGLLQLQQAVVAACPPAVDNHFLAGHWVSHITLGRRFRPEQIADALRVLGPSLAAEKGTGGRDATVAGARYWQGDRKLAQELI